MTKVFVSGSMKIRRLDREFLDRLENVISNNLCVIVGDAKGVDASVQEYLSGKGVKSVLVYCTGEEPRYNLGRWPTVTVESTGKPGTRQYYTAKDVQMAEDCDYGLMVWDTKSTGTLSNTIELLKRRKKALVFINKRKAFMTISNPVDLEAMIGHMSSTSFQKAEVQLRIRQTLDALRHRQENLFSEFER